MLGKGAVDNIVSFWTYFACLNGTFTFSPIKSFNTYVYKVEYSYTVQHCITVIYEQLFIM